MFHQSDHHSLRFRSLTAVVVVLLLTDSNNVSKPQSEAGVTIEFWDVYGVVRLLHFLFPARRASR